MIDKERQALQGRAEAAERQRDEAIAALFRLQGEIDARTPLSSPKSAAQRCSGGQALVARLEEEATRLSGYSLDHGSADAGLTANLAAEAVAEIERLRGALRRIDSDERVPPWIREIACAALDSNGITA